jgi:hypothetical protein
MFGQELSAICFALMCLVFALPAPVQAQVMFEIESRDHRVSPPRSETTFVVSDGRQLATGLTSGASAVENGMIYRGSRRELVVLNHRDRTYMLLDVPTMQRLTSQLNQLTTGQTFGQSSPKTPAQVRRSEDFAQCFGFPATRYEVWRDGRLVREMYVTDWQNIDGGREVAAVFTDMGGFLEQMMAALPASGGSSPADDSIFSEMRQIEGFPVGVREYRADGALQQEWALRSAKRQRVDPTTFAPPADYRQQKMPGS